MRTVTTIRVKCRVKGCGRPQGNRKRGLCTMHTLRVLRTGEVGPARTLYRDPSAHERPSRRKLAVRSLRRLMGSRKTVLARCVGPGSLAVTSGGRRLGATSISVVMGLSRRGWIATETRPDGSLWIGITVRGRVALRG
jgi:hypothetical protein